LATRGLCAAPRMGLPSGTRRDDHNDKQTTAAMAKVAAAA
jgi:hypothetical protein